MSRHHCHRWLALGLLTLLGCQPPAAQFTAADEAAIRGRFDSSLGYIRANDWTAWAGGFREDAILQPPNGPTVSGRAALDAWGHAFPPIENISWTNVQVWGEGDMAYATSAYGLKLKDQPADSGKQLVVLRRGASGTWETVAVSFNSDVPLPAPVKK